MAEKRRSVHGKAVVKEDVGASPCRPLASGPSQEVQCSVPDAEPAPGGWAGRAHSMVPSGVYSPHPQRASQPFPRRREMGTLLLVL